MAKFIVKASYITYLSAEIEADSLEEAQDIARDMDGASFDQTDAGDWNIDDVEEVEGDYVTCPHCGEVSHIGGLIGPTTDDCPRCGGRILGAA